MMKLVVGIAPFSLDATLVLQARPVLGADRDE